MGVSTLTATQCHYGGVNINRNTVPLWRCKHYPQHSANMGVPTTATQCSHRCVNINRNSATMGVSTITATQCDYGGVNINRNSANIEVSTLTATQ